MELGPTTTTTEVLEGIDLTGRTALVTGASAGLGVETARSLASAGAHVLLACRDPDKGHAAIERIRTSVPDASLELGPVDLASLSSVRSFAADVGERHRRIDLLINNAGVMACPLGRTAEGFELQLGTNHLGHFLLTNLLTSTVVAGSAPRIVNLTSRGHVRSGIHWDDPHYRTRPYDKWEAYGQSKTANILFTVELERRLAPKGVHAYAVHPGVIATELSRHLNRDDFTAMAARMPSGRMPLKSVEAGAATTVWAATSPALAGIGGVYLEDCHISDTVTGPDGTDGHAAWALDPEDAVRLWAWSEDQVGDHFPA